MSYLLRNVLESKCVKKFGWKSFETSLPPKKIKLMNALIISLIFMLFIGVYSSDLVQMRAEDYPLGDIPISNETFLKYYRDFTYTMDTAYLSTSSYDARAEGIVSAAKDQGRCGSCWAFACVGAMESHIKKTFSASQLYDLSEQQLLTPVY